VAASGTQDYQVTKFVLWTQQPDPTNPIDPAEIVMAIPEADAVFAKYVSKTVPFDFTVYAFEKNEVPVDVLCFIPEKVDEFGFFWFVIDEIIIREQCFFGDLCIKDKENYEGEGSLYATVFGDNGSLAAYPFDLPAIFKVVVRRTNEGFLWEKEFSNVDADNNFIAPLCIKYPDRVGITDNYELELWVLVAQDDGWEYVLFEEMTFANDELIENKVIDFVIGNCNYNPGDAWVFPAWMNLPATATIGISHNITQYNNNTWEWLYWKLNVSAVFDKEGNQVAAPNYDILNPGNWAAFCGDGQKTIPQTTFTFEIYNSLSFDYDSGKLPSYITKEKINSVHWLFNNLSTYGYQIEGLYIEPGELTTQEGKQIQDAIWLIINGASASGVPWNYSTTTPTPSEITIGTMASNAVTNGATFNPLPGQWASVLLVTDHPEVGKYYQLILTVVDP
jgi:hypothetical protein